MDIVGDLARILAPGEQRASMRLRQGKVIAVAADHTVTVTIGGDPTQISGVAVASHVCPIPGRACWLLVDGRDAFVLATIGGGGIAHGKQRQNAAQSIPHNVYTALSWATRTQVIERGVTQGASGLTIKVPGLWMVTASVIFPTNTTGIRALRLTRNGSSTDNPGILSDTPVNGQHQMSVTEQLDCGLEDVLGAEVFQSSGVALSTVLGSTAGVITATWLGPSP